MPAATAKPKRNRHPRRTKPEPAKRTRAVRRSLDKCYNPAALYAVYLRDNGWLAAVNDVLKITGWRGYRPVDIFWFIFIAITCQPGSGFDKFYNAIILFKSTLANLAGRKTLPSDSAVFRYCDEVTDEIAANAGLKLTAESAVQGIIQAGPAAAVKDTNGKPYHIIDADFTAEAFRQRKCIDGMEYDPAIARLEDVAAVGFAGSKRGDVVQSRGLVYHGGTSHFLGTMMVRGTGDFSSLITLAVERAKLLSQGANIPCDQIVVRMDGAGGNGRCAGIVAAAGFVPLVRVARYELLETPQLQKTLNSAAWWTVPESLEGLTRYAADAGNIVMPVNSPDLDLPPEITLRLIVSRYQAKTEAKSPMPGKKINGWHYEMFATLLPAGGWPPAETVQLYFERGGGVENGISMQRKETGLGYLFTEDLKPLRLINNLGLFAWNIKLNMGQQMGAPGPEPRKEPRKINAASGLPLPFPDLAAGTDSGIEEEQNATAAPPAPTPAAQALPDKGTENESDPVAAILRQMDPPPSTGNSKDVWESQTMSFVCEAKQRLTLHGVRKMGGGFYMIFRAAARVCPRCPQRGNCTKSVAKSFCRQVSIRISEEMCQTLNAALDSPARPTPSRSRFVPVLPDIPPGPRRMTPSALFPRKTRKRFEDLCKGLVVSVTVSGSPPPRKQPSIDDIYQEKQHRRQTVLSKLMKNHLSGKVAVNIQFFPEFDPALLIPPGGAPKNMPGGLPVNVAFRVSSLPN